MTNADNLRSMEDDVLAWWLNDYLSDCSCCIYDGCENCKDIEDKMTCVDGITAWLKAEPNAKDMKRYETALHNALVMDRNKSIEAHNAVEAIPAEYKGMYEAFVGGKR